MKRTIPTLLALAILGIGIYSMQTEKSAQANIPGRDLPNANAAAPGQPGQTPAQAASSIETSRQSASLPASPFGIGGDIHATPTLAATTNLAATSTPDKEVVSAEEVARRKKMEKLGYMVPPDYYTKNLTALKDLAKKGDAFALVHLGEKYYFELNGQKTNPEFDPKADYPALARESFSQALASGNIRSAGIIAELYLQENNPVDAYAWHLISKRLDDSISAEWFQTTKTYRDLTEGQKQQAQAKIPDLINNLNGLSTKLKTKPLF